MPAFKANAALAAMSKRAADVLRRQGQAVLPSGQTATRPRAQPTEVPRSLLANRVSQLGGATQMNPNMVAALKINPYQARSRESVYAAAAARGQQQVDVYQRSLAQGLENPDQFLGNAAGYYAKLGMTGEDVNAAAFRYAQGRSYGGQGYAPGLVMQEGTVEYKNGVPGIYVKYRQGSTSSTEWTPLQ